MNDGFWLRIGAAWGFLAVAIGAFGAHGLKERLEATGKAASFQTGSNYHMYMALALVAVGLVQLLGRRGSSLDVAGWMFLVGSICFSGSIYGLCLTDWRWLIPVTPIGGVLIMVGWAALALAAGSANDRAVPAAERASVGSSSPGNL